MGMRRLYAGWDEKVPDTRPWADVRCSTCHTKIGITKAARLAGSVFCSELCAADRAANSNEERDDLIVELYRQGKDLVWLAVEFDITRQRVHQILKGRGVLPSKVG